MNIRRIGAAAAAVALSGTLLAGCSSAANAGEVNLLVSSDPGSLDPTQLWTQGAEELYPFMYETLIQFPRDGEPRPGLAESWETSSDETTFTLRDDVTCADGSQFTVDDVAATFEYNMDPSTSSIHLGSAIPVAGVDIKTNADARTITFRSRGDDRDGFRALNFGMVPMICKSGLNDPSTLATSPQGTGPYTLADMVPGQSYTFKVRDDYTWGWDGATSADLPETVSAEVVTSDSTRANMLQSGQANIGYVGGSDRDRVDAAQPTSSVDLTIGSGKLLFNQSEGRPFADQTLREAAVQAIDRTSVGDVISEGRGEMLTSLTPQSPVCSASDSTGSIPQYDPAAAAKTVASAAPPKIVLIFNPDETSAITPAMELVQSELTGAGFNVELTPSNQWVDVVVGGGDWDMVWFSNNAALPSTWYQAWTGAAPPDGRNWARIANEEYAAIGARANGLQGAEACAAWQDATDALFSASDVLPLSTYTKTLYGVGVDLQASALLSLQPSSMRLK
ncbi:ABC transporter substrate-binding protein [Leucobacter sp. wl10]|uniref:ABC transporter substrate-binding protein n=1 Tax=Leucobacter sp. wl10 TaxID=2304677 RepID=UPI000E5BD418|nr:ABC transporter substrate-binding protein [Leucobacter sp. wl10]RGE18947.1 ABC transporter substrate-binding protein [Leucobacter sp. wl10]